MKAKSWPSPATNPEAVQCLVGESLAGQLDSRVLVGLFPKRNQRSGCPLFRPIADSGTRPMMPGLTHCVARRNTHACACAVLRRTLRRCANRNTLSNLIFGLIAFVSKRRRASNQPSQSFH